MYNIDCYIDYTTPKKGDADRRNYGGCTDYLVHSEHCEAAEPVQTSLHVDLRTMFISIPARPTN